jgi:hypothetical protein
MMLGFLEYGDPVSEMIYSPLILVFLLLFLMLLVTGVMRVIQRCYRVRHFPEREPDGGSTPHARHV